jgi:hypothetical protein
MINDINYYTDPKIYNDKLTNKEIKMSKIELN